MRLKCLIFISGFLFDCFVFDFFFLQWSGFVYLWESVADGWFVPPDLLSCSMVAKIELELEKWEWVPVLGARVCTSDPWEVLK